MQKSYRFLVSALLLGAFLLSACSGAVPQQDDSSQSSAGSQSSEVVFTGTVQSIGGGQWLISDQQINVDGSTSVDPSIQVGDIVKVEASVSQDGVVLALTIESSGPDDDANENTANDNDSNTNDDNANTNDNTNTDDDNSNGNTNANSNDDMDDDDQEVFGVVEAITTDSIMIDGVAYSIASFTEFKDLIALGDQVKVHVIVNADGTFTIREIEKTTDTGIGDDNGNANDNDDNGNSNGNSNDDDDDDNSNSNSNDDDSNDNGGDDNSNDSNSNGG